VFEVWWSALISDIKSRSSPAKASLQFVRTLSATSRFSQSALAFTTLKYSTNTRSLYIGLLLRFVTVRTDSNNARTRNNRQPEFQAIPEDLPKLAVFHPIRIQGI
jgi:hypothetical protein